MTYTSVYSACKCAVLTEMTVKIFTLKMKLKKKKKRLRAVLKCSTRNVSVNP